MEYQFLFWNQLGKRCIVASITGQIWWTKLRIGHACVPQWCVLRALTYPPGLGLDSRGLCFTPYTAGLGVNLLCFFLCLCLAAFLATFGCFCAHQCLGALFGCVAVCVAPFARLSFWQSLLWSLWLKRKGDGRGEGKRCQSHFALYFIRWKHARVRAACVQRAVFFLFCASKEVTLEAFCSHLFPKSWVNHQKAVETSVPGNGVAWN